MPYIENNGVRIYYEIEGKGPPLVLQHGWSNSLEYWRDFGYIEPLKEDYRLILIDARGHGNSDIPNDPEAYEMDLMAEDVIAVLDHLNIGKAHFLGYSSGGWIAFHLAKIAPERFTSFIIGGAHPYAESLVFARELINRGMDAFISIWDEAGAPLSEKVRENLLNHELFPLVACVSKDRPDMSSVLHKMTMPCLIYAGENDFRYEGVKECAENMANGIFVSLPGLDHLEAQVRSDLMLPHIRKFLEGIES